MQNRFAQADIRDSALELINALLTRIEAARTPEKVAENDHLMKCPWLVSLSFDCQLSLVADLGIKVSCG